MDNLASYNNQIETEAADEQDLVARLRLDIVNGEYLPGARLKFAALAERYGVGYGNLREALSQLTSEGFSTQELNKGFAVAAVSRRELVEITDLYTELEQRAIRRALECGNEMWEANIVAAHHRLRAIEKQPWQQRVERHSEWVIRHRDFHFALVSACDGEWLLKLRTRMFDQLDRYRFVTKTAAKGVRSGRAGEHRRLMEAALDRDQKLAAELIEAHVRKTAKFAVKLLDN